MERESLKQSDREEEYETTTDWYFTLIDAFLVGFRSDEVLPSALNCSKYTRQSSNVYNKTRQQWQNESNPDYGNRREEIFDSAHWISYSLAPGSRYCFMTSLESVMFVQHKTTQFDGFGELLPAWLQNLMGNIITLNAI